MSDNIRHLLLQQQAGEGASAAAENTRQRVTLVLSGVIDISHYREETIFRTSSARGLIAGVNYAKI